ncbi:MAG: SpoIID/LytB domain-containing protein [Candidatus Bruticola sp.]
MNYKRQRFIYCSIFILIACIVAAYSSYAGVIRDYEASSGKSLSRLKTAEKKEHQKTEEADMMASYVESSQDTKEAFSPSLEIKVGLPEIISGADLTASNGIIYPKGQAKAVKIRLITTVFKKVKMQFYDERDHLLFNSEEPVVLRPAETYSDGEALSIDDPGICTLTLSNEQTNSKTQAAYRGSLTFAIKPDETNPTISVVNNVTIEDYLKGVVPSEVPASFDNEALKAMACVARSYTLANLGRHSKEGFDLCAGTHCHVYGGAKVENANVNAQIEATKGLIVCSGKLIADTRYHAVCGGMGESIENVWDKAQPTSYLTTSSDAVNGLSWNSGREETYDSYYESYEGDYQEPSAEPFSSVNPSAIVENTPQLEKRFRAFIDNPLASYCMKAKLFRWQASYSSADFQRMIRESLPVLCGVEDFSIGGVTDIKVVKRTGSGRVAELSIVTDRGSFSISGDKIRWIIGGGKINPLGLKSTLFYVYKDNDTIIFKGGGWGHGVGLCQEGAQGRAKSGQSYTDIIKHYYPGCELKAVH